MATRPESGAAKSPRKAIAMTVDQICRLEAMKLSIQVRASGEGTETTIARGNSYANYIEAGTIQPV